jgi:hypothetical protein
MGQLDSGKSAGRGTGFGDDFGLLVDYCLASPEFMVLHPPTEMALIGNPAVLEQIALDASSGSVAGMEDLSQSAELINDAGADVYRIANHSLWQALKYMTHVIVHRELNELRAERLSSCISKEPDINFSELHQSIRSNGVVASMMEWFNDERMCKLLLTMCCDPKGLREAYSAHQQFELSKASQEPRTTS